MLAKSGYKEAFVGWTRNFVKHVMDDEKVDVVNLIMHEIREKQTNFETNLYYAPYIMSLILDKTKFKGPCDVKHTSYKPFKNQPDFLNRELTPYLEVDQDVEYDDPEGDQAEGSGAHHDDQAAPPPPPMHAQWEPPAGYFDSYFASMQQSLSSQIQQVQTGFADHFEAYGQQINNTFQSMQHGFQHELDNRFNSFGHAMYMNMHQPMMNSLQGIQQSLHTDIEALNAKFDGLTTSEQHQQLMDRHQQLETDFHAFSGHFYSIFPTPVPPPDFYPH